MYLQLNSKLSESIKKEIDAIDDNNKKPKHQKNDDWRFYLFIVILLAFLIYSRFFC